MNEIVNAERHMLVAYANLPETTDKYFWHSLVRVLDEKYPGWDKVHINVEMGLLLEALPESGIRTFKTQG